MEIIYLLSFVIHTLLIGIVCLSKIVSCFFCKKFHILIVLSSEPETIYFLSLLIATLNTLAVCPSKIIFSLFCKIFHTLTFLSSEPEIIYFSSSVITIQVVVGEGCIGINNL